MNELLAIPLLPVGLTVLAYWIGHSLQKKLKLSILSPIVVGAGLVLLTLWATGLPMEKYQQGMKYIDWLLTPATVCLAVPMYEHFQTLRKNFPVVLVSVFSGCAVCIMMIFGFGFLFGFDGALTVSLLPKSVTTAIGVSLSQLNGGIPPGDHRRHCLDRQSGGHHWACPLQALPADRPGGPGRGLRHLRSRGGHLQGIRAG